MLGMLRTEKEVPSYSLSRKLVGGHPEDFTSTLS